MLNSINNSFAVTKIGTDKQSYNVDHPSFRGDKLQFNGTLTNDTFEHSERKKSKKALKIIAVSLAALVIGFGGVCLYKGRRALGKNAKFGEKLKQGLMELRGKSITKDLDDGTRVIKQVENGKLLSFSKYKGDEFLLKNDYKYGENGKISCIKCQKGNEIIESTFKYNEKNQLSEIIKKITREGSDKKDIINIDFRNYDNFQGRGFIKQKKNGKISSVTRFDSGICKYRHEYERGVNGKICRFKSSKLGESSEMNFRYDSNQKLLRVTKDIIKESPNKKDVVKIDVKVLDDGTRIVKQTENGKLIVGKKYKGNELLYKQEFKYGENGKVSSIECLEGNGSVTIREPFYNNDNQVTGLKETCKDNKKVTIFYPGTRIPKYKVKRPNDPHFGFYSLCQYDKEGKLLFEYGYDNPKYWTKAGDINMSNELLNIKDHTSYTTIKPYDGATISHFAKINKDGYLYEQFTNEDNNCIHKTIYTNLMQPNKRIIKYSNALDKIEINENIIKIFKRSIKSMDEIAQYNMDTGKIDIIDNKYTADAIKKIINRAKVIDDDIAKAANLKDSVNEAWDTVKNVLGIEKDANIFSSLR